jgi:hypothetical protein
MNARRFLWVIAACLLLCPPVRAATMLKQIVNFHFVHTRTQTTTWNPSDKCTNITLSGSNQIATGGSTWCSVRATTSFTVGTVTKRVFNITVTAAASNLWIGGVANAALSLTNYPGQSAVSGGWQSDATNNCYFSGYTGTPACNSAQTLNSAGTVEWIAIDFNTGNLWWSSNCTSWFRSAGAANPDTGNNFNITFPAATVLYPAVSLGSSSNKATLNTYPSLTGCSNIGTFVPWDY